jgi:hypothetical protein
MAQALFDKTITMAGVLEDRRDLNRQVVEGFTR